jgi:hypothetical protein
VYLQYQGNAMITLQYTKEKEFELVRDLTEQGGLATVRLRRAAAPVKETAVRWVRELPLGVAVLHDLLKREGRR